MTTRPKCHVPVGALGSGRPQAPRNTSSPRCVLTLSLRRSAQTQPLRSRHNARTPHIKVSRRAQNAHARAVGWMGSSEQQRNRANYDPPTRKRATDTTPQAINTRRRRHRRRNEPRALCAAECIHRHTHTHTHTHAHTHTRPPPQQAQRTFGSIHHCTQGARSTAHTPPAERRLKIHAPRTRDPTQCAHVDARATHAPRHPRKRMHARARQQAHARHHCTNNVERDRAVGTAPHPPDQHARHGAAINRAATRRNHHATRATRNHTRPPHRNRNADRPREHASSASTRVPTHAPRARAATPTTVVRAAIARQPTLPTQSLYSNAIGRARPHASAMLDSLAHTIATILSARRYTRAHRVPVAKPTRAPHRLDDRVVNDANKPEPTPQHGQGDARPIRGARFANQQYSGAWSRSTDLWVMGPTR